eukprot:1317719-Pleurochrysis_carterae.AAC.3
MLISCAHRVWSRGRRETRGAGTEKARKSNKVGRFAGKAGRACVERGAVALKNASERAGTAACAARLCLASA